MRGAWQNATLGYWLAAAPTRPRPRDARRAARRSPTRFAHGELHRVQAAVIPRNTASLAVVRRAGLRHEGTALRYLRIAGLWEDHEIFAATVEDGPCAGPTIPGLMAFPATRMRRLRRTSPLRDLVRETRLSRRRPRDAAVRRGGDRRAARRSRRCPGVARLPLADAGARGRRDRGARDPRACCCSASPREKDAEGSGAWDEEGIVQQATRAIKAAQPDLLVIADLCLCEYTSHGHCGLLAADGSVDNDATLELLARTAVAQARAGADIIAPSDMMDGRVGAIRAALDEEGFTEIPILAYSAKFASAFYGPFREAAGSAPAFGDRRGYQMDPGNAREALREALLDVEEGADIVMVKPALPYLDVIRRIADATTLPVAAYNVSGEYAMVKAAAAAGWLDERAAVLETLTAIRRAGADIVISYHAKDAARWLQAT